ncbi:MAG: InlB B-repeat-containing protein [Erysipelotrichaceae bacterium]|jgi:uncharacterized repeat protein (TIGR02543 family)|nr:InlB B-repeat-containing protein [Erysipelotrichaceae bacterium]
MQKNLKKIIAVFLLISVCFFAKPFQTKAVSSFSVGTFGDLQTALNDSDTQIQITLTASISLTAPISVASGKNVTISGGGYTLSRAAGNTGDLISVFNQSTLTLFNVVVDGNKTAVPVSNGSLLYVDGVLNLGSDAVVQNNHSGDSPGGGINVTANGALHITGGEVAYNNSNTHGGGIYVAGAFTMDGGKIHHNDNNNTAAIVYGGGIYFTNTSTAATIANAEIYNNTTNRAGGGFSNDGAGVTITNTRIYDNHATIGGGFAISQQGTSSLSGGSEVTGNIASNPDQDGGNAGGIYIGSNHTLTIDGALISQNTSLTWGGGITNVGHLIVENADITNNSATLQGGGIANDAWLDFKAGTVSGNHAAMGGGIFISAGGRGSSEDVHITGGTITENDAENGGGIYIQNGSTVTISDVLITKNITSGHGGGIFVTEVTGTNLTITDSTISFNKAGSAGGGIGVASRDRHEVHIGSGVVFSDNCIMGQAYDIDPADQAAYESLVDQDTTWSKPMTQGYNNIDIEYEGGEPVGVVYFETNEGGSIDPQKVEQGGLAIKPTDPVKVNKYFSGWYSDKTLNNKYDFTTPVNGTVVLYAKWVDNQSDIDYLINFNSNGGSNVPSQTVARDALVIKPNDPTYSSKIFSGWHSDEALTTRYDFNLPVTSDMTLYARWVDSIEESDYLVSFVANGGTAVTAQTVNYGEKAIKPADPTKPGYKFTGWYSDDQFTYLYDFTLSVYADVTLYAKWGVDDPNLTYTIYFNKNIPFGTTDNVTSMPASADVLANGTFVVTSAFIPVGSPTSAAGNYTFMGWATSPTGSVAFKATAYNSDSGILNSAPDKVILGAIYGLNQSIPEVGSDMNLYAIWLPPSSSNGGSGGSSGSGTSSGGFGSSVVLTGVTSSLEFYLLTMMMAAGVLKIKKKKN